ncbi:MAG: peroxidase-related enzyme [Pseudomonadota bacterium]|nr:peroxidase-related enzyme [Pseudomonadota bacterium]
MKKKIKKSDIWSLNIHINLKKADSEIKEYLSICKDKLGLIPNILIANATDKDRFKAFNIFYNRLMQNENYLTKSEKEMIAVVVSSLNRCLYCCVSHSYNLGRLVKNKILSQKILINYKTADLNRKHTEMLDFTSKLTLSSHLVNENDRSKLRRVGFNENQILEIVEVCAFFNMTNRIASGTNMKPNKEYYLSQ